MSTTATEPGTSPRDLRFFLLVTVVNAVVHFGQGVAVGWSVYELTGSALALGFVGLAQFLPILLFFLPAGQVADRFERRRVVVASLVLMGCASTLLAVAAALHWHVGWIYAALTFSGVAQIQHRPARDALLPALVSNARLPASIALVSSLHQIASMAAPAVAGALIAVFHAALPIYLLNLALVLLGIAATLAIRQRSRGQAAVSGKGRLAEVLAGFTHVWRTRVLLAVMSIDLVAVLFGGAVALLPIYAKDILHVGPSGLGILSTAPAVGAAIAGVLIARFGVALDWRVFLVAVAGFGVFTIIFGLSTSFPLSVLALVLLGGCDSVSVVIRQTVQQQHTPDALRGRVGAVSRVFIGSSNELGALESGLLSAAIGPLAAVVAGGVVTLAVAALGPRVFPQLRTLRRQRA